VLDKPPQLSSYDGWKPIVFMLLAIVGGFISFLEKSKNEDGKYDWNWRGLLLNILTSGFVGFITIWGCELMGTPWQLAGIVTGIGGHMGAEALQLFSSVFRRWLDRLSNFLGAPDGNNDQRPKG
jgi:hypothetical protein